MNRDLLFFLIVFFPCSASPLLAQEELSPEEIYRWIPEGEYSRIYHHDVAAMTKADTYSWFKTVTDHWPEQFPYEALSTSMQGKFDSRTIFLMARIKVSQWKKGDSVESGQNPTASAQIGGKEFLYTHIGEHLFVYRFDDAHSLINVALVKGELSSTDIIIHDIPVYSFSHEGQLFYMLTTESQEILVTRKQDLLERMVSTGFGQAPGLFHDQNYADLIELTPTIGQYWVAHDFAISARVNIAMMKQNNGDEEEIERREEKLRTANYINIVNWIIGDSLEEQRVFVFGDEEFAKGYENRVMKRRALAKQSDDPADFKLYLKERANSSKWIVDGRIVRRVFTYDDNLVQRYIKGFEALEAMEKEAKNRKKDKKD